MTHGMKKPTGYASWEQRDAVLEIVRFLLAFDDRNNSDHISQETLALAFRKYVALVGAVKKPGDLK